MMMLRKIFGVVALAYFAGQLLMWSAWDIVPNETATTLALIFCCYVIVRDIVLLLYIESKINLETMTPRD